VVFGLAGCGIEAHLILPDVLDEILKKPTVRAEAVLDGVFAQAVIVVEADGDRTVYQAVFETLGNELRHLFDRLSGACNVSQQRCQL
jgi:hypothetical protein